MAKTNISKRLISFIMETLLFYGVIYGIYSIMPDDQIILISAIFIVLIIQSISIYYSGSFIFGRALKIKIVNVDGDRISFIQALARTMFISISAFFTNTFLIVFSIIWMSNIPQLANNDNIIKLSNYFQHAINFNTNPIYLLSLLAIFIIFSFPLFFIFLNKGKQTLYDIMIGSKVVSVLLWNEIGISRNSYSNENSKKKASIALSFLIIFVLFIIINVSLAKGFFNSYDKNIELKSTNIELKSKIGILNVDDVSSRVNEITVNIDKSIKTLNVSGQNIILNTSVLSANKNDNEFIFHVEINFDPNLINTRNKYLMLIAAIYDIENVKKITSVKRNSVEIIYKEKDKS